MDRTFTIRNSDWQATLQEIEGDESVANIIVERAGGQNFHATMVDDSIVQQDGKVVNFRQLFLFEHDQGLDKVGDVVIVFRQHPQTHRFMVQVEEENVFEAENNVKKGWRAKRSSVDNIAQAAKKTLTYSGWTYSNTRRIGGKPIRTHYVLAGWSVQVQDEMMDVYDYVQTMDAPGHSSFLKALVHMPDQSARSIFEQMRSAPLNGNNGS